MCSVGIGNQPVFCLRGRAILSTVIRDKKMDRVRFKSIRRREHELMKRYRKEGKDVRRAWHGAMSYMASRGFESSI